RASSRGGRRRRTSLAWWTCFASCCCWLTPVVALFVSEFYQCLAGLFGEPAPGVICKIVGPVADGALAAQVVGSFGIVARRCEAVGLHRRCQGRIHAEEFVHPAPFALHIHVESLVAEIEDATR